MLYLASQSPRRKTILNRTGIRFKILTPNIREGLEEKGENPKRLAIRNAERKVRSVAHRIKEGVILGVDTIVVLKGKALGKPKSKQEARRMLQSLSGKTHLVISGIFLLKKPENITLATWERTRVRFRKLTKREIEDYINTKEPYDKAGAYAIQGRAGIFVERINGCYNNVVGLPLPRILRLLRKFR